ncbi:hypothetical protein NOCA180203 [metagenome]|uniref:Uncharacterized protein n=1 Tax=metagenome TaxID=256318 RepID=A0A2P2CKT0_9ZZZZ
MRSGTIPESTNTANKKTARSSAGANWFGSHQANRIAFAVAKTPPTKIPPINKPRMKYVRAQSRQTDEISIAELWLHTEPDIEKPAAMAATNQKLDATPDCDAASTATDSTAVITSGWVKRRARP